MNLSKKTKKASIFVVTTATVFIVVFGSFSVLNQKPIEAEPQFSEKHLFVEEIYLLKTSSTNKSINITCTPYLTNIWEKESGEIKVVAYVVKESNKVADCKKTVEIGKIKADSTAEIEIPLTLSDNSYQVDILIFEDEKLVLKGSLKIKTEVNLIKEKIYNESGEVLRIDCSYSWQIECEDGAESFEHIEHKIKYEE